MASSSPHRPSSPDVLTGLPKDAPSRGPPTPPPAYFPRQLLPISSSNNNYMMSIANNLHSSHRSVNAHLAARFAGINLPLPPQHAVDAAALGWANLENYHRNRNVTGSAEASYEDEEDEEDEDGQGSSSTARSAVTVRISTAVRVRGDGNVVCVGPAHPADTARAVADAVTRAITRADEEGGRAGVVPMIDEEGRPRPLRIEIEAGIEVRGRGNVLGGREVVMKALGKRRRGLEEDEGEDGAPRARQRARSVGG